MNNKEKIEFYAKVYNTIQEICWTELNEDLNNHLFWELNIFLEDLDWQINKSEEFNEEEKKEFLRLTDHIRDRIYFTI